MHEDVVGDTSITIHGHQAGEIGTGVLSVTDFDDGAAGGEVVAQSEVAFGDVDHAPQAPMQIVSAEE